MLYLRGVTALCAGGVIGTVDFGALVTCCVSGVAPVSLVHEQVQAKTQEQDRIGQESNDVGRMRGE